MVNVEKTRSKKDEHGEVASIDAGDTHRPDPVGGILCVRDASLVPLVNFR
jgi:hypothetical protein